jgi:hypothetical protein
MQASAAPKSTIGKPKGLKPGAIKAKPATRTNAAGLTKAQFEAAAQKAWGATPKGSAKKQKQSADQQLDKLATKSRNMVQSRTGLTKSDAMKASDLGKATGRRVEVSQTPLGGYSIRVAPVAAKPKLAQDLVNASVRKVQNQKLRNLNAQIKEAGPNAAGLRLQKLQLQSNMSSTRPRTTAKQAAKSAKQDESIRGRIAEMRRQSGRIQRAEANRQRTADVRTGAAAGSKASFARRPSAKTTRSNLRAERALAFYSNPAKALREVNKKKPGFRLPRGMR